MIFLYTFFTEVFGLKKCCGNDMILTETDDSDMSIICLPNPNQEKSFQIFQTNEVLHLIITFALYICILLFISN